MFRCEKCNNLSKPGEKQFRLVTETRPQTYVNNVHGVLVESQGTEIVKEIKVCGGCK